ENNGDLDPGSTLAYEVQVFDQFGNLIPTAPYEIWTEPAGGTFDSDRVRFLTEGVFDIIAEIEGTPLRATAGPFIVDSSGPIIEITSPERGIATTSSQVTVTGTVYDTVTDVDSLTVGDAKLPIGAGGNFSLVIDAEPGINLIEVTAVDSEGHTSTAYQAFLYAPFFSSRDTTFTNALGVRLNQQSIDFIEEQVEGLVDINAIRQELEGMRVWGRSCVNLLFGDACAWVDIDRFTSSSLDVQLQPTSSGYLQLTARLYNPYVRVKVDTNITGAVYPYISADRATVSARATLSVNNGNIQVGLTNVSVSLSGFDMGLSSLPGWLNDILTLGDLLSGLVRDELEDVIKDEIVSAAGPAIDGALTELELGTTLHLLGSDIRVDVEPQYFSIDNSGVTMALKSKIRALDIDPRIEGTGIPRTTASIPSFGTTPGFHIAVSDDFLNQAIYALWESGLINRVVDEQIGDLDLSFLEYLIPDATGFEFEVDPILPPVIVPKSTANSQAELQVGDMLLDIYAIRNGSRTLVTRVAVS
ncbi:MAG: hypothetical protein KC561_17535, partial [Myxococcales bacterium]|nr:hypothetical protein [Myxococcales bacterium]